MAIHYRTLGLILKKEDQREADRIFTVYTKDFGKLELLAKAERKIESKLRGGLETFYLSEIEFIRGKTYKTLTDAILIENFKNIRKDLERLKIAYQITELLDSLVRGEEKDEKIWELLNAVFRKLNNCQTAKLPNCQLFYYYFLWNFLSILGYQPEIYSCAICQKKLTPGKLYFSFKEGGVICSNCLREAKNPNKIEPETIKILRILLKEDWNTLSRLKMENSDKKSLKIISDIALSFILDER